MSEPINMLVVDLSHYDDITDYDALKAAGIVGILYKATEGDSYQDPTYPTVRTKALREGFKWGAFHFCNNTDIEKQAANFLGYAQVDEDSIFCLDYEDEPNGNTISFDNMKSLMTLLENGLGRPNDSLLYSGNTLKENINTKGDPFLSKRRLWLAQYSITPTWPKATWPNYWLWQYSDQGRVPGIGKCDVNSYAGTAAQLLKEWAHGTAVPTPPQLVTINIQTPPGITVKVNINGMATLA